MTLSFAIAIATAIAIPFVIMVTDYLCYSSERDGSAGSLEEGENVSRGRC